MGLFFERNASPSAIEDQLVGALMTPPPETQADARDAAKPMAKAAAAAGPTTEVHSGRIAAAFGLFLLLLAVSILADHFKWVADPKYLYGFATTVLGVIVGWLGGEAGASS